MTDLSRGMGFHARSCLLIKEHQLFLSVSPCGIEVGAHDKKFLASTSEYAFISDTNRHALTIEVFEQWDSILSRDGQ
jgi:hypothetical protein